MHAASRFLRLSPTAYAWVFVAVLSLPIPFANCVVAQELTAADVFRAWRGRQGRTESLHCRVTVLANYAAGSQLVPGEQEPLPVTSRSSKRAAELFLSGPAKWRIDHQGNQFHRRLGRMLEFDLTRVTDGNQYLLNERGYDKVTDWQPQPRIYSSPRTFRQELYWNDVTFAPVLLHYRPFNSMLCPFVEQTYVIDPKRKTINSHQCVLLQPSHTAPFSVRKYRYWVAEQMDMSVVRIERVMNGAVEWQYDIETVNQDGQWQPKSYVIRRMQEGEMVEFSKVTITDLKLNGPVADELFKVAP